MGYHSLSLFYSETAPLRRTRTIHKMAYVGLHMTFMAFYRKWWFLLGIFQWENVQDMGLHTFVSYFSNWRGLSCKKLSFNVSRTNCNVTNRNVTNHRFAVVLQTDKTFCNELYIKQLFNMSAMKWFAKFYSDGHSLGKGIFQKSVFFFHVLFV